MDTDNNARNNGHFHEPFLDRLPSVDLDRLSNSEKLELFSEVMRSDKLRTMVPFLPLMLNLNGRPYTLDNHFVFEPVFDLDMPRKMTVIAARQCGKSASIAGHGVMLAACIPRFKSLYILPQSEQTCKFSTNYVQPFIDESPVRQMLVQSKSRNSVYQKSFKNKAILFFTYAGLTVSRARGIPTDRCTFDEVADIDPDHVPIIEESMSASQYKISVFTGTPTTMDSLAHQKWEESSQAEWVIVCEACNKENVPALDYHLDKMMGPWREDISPDNPGVICANPRCARPIQPRNGRWRHRYPERRKDFAGYHVPQIIMPMHYGSPSEWAMLLGKRDTYGAARFYNEVMGVSYDIAAKLVTQSELKEAACLDHENKESEAVGLIGKYTTRVLSADWGGGGKKGVSFTKLAVLGLTTTGTIDVIFGKALPNPMDHVGEARECRRVFDKFRCHLMSHDYTGAGSLRETILAQTGMDAERLMPMAYDGPVSGGFVKPIAPTPQHPRLYYRVDKSSSLQATCYCIKLGGIRFFKYDYISPERPGLLHDFLALVEEKNSRATSSDSYFIHRQPNASDDFAQAVNIGCCAIWHANNAFPDFSMARGVPTPTPAVSIPLNPDIWQGDEEGGGDGWDLAGQGY